MGVDAGDPELSADGTRMLLVIDLGAGNEKFDLYTSARSCL